MSELRQRKAERSDEDAANTTAPTTTTSTPIPTATPSPDAAPDAAAAAPASPSRKTSVCGLCAALGKGVLLLVLFVFVIPFIANQGAVHTESMFFLPAPENFHTVGYGTKFYMQCFGDGDVADDNKGKVEKTTVILENAAGETAESWYYVVEKFVSTEDSPFRVCVYDRLGLGHTGTKTINDPARNPYKHMGAQLPERKGVPFSTERATEDLRELVNAANISRPFILIGNELGSLHARFYAQLYEGDVAGVVLVNPLPETLFSDERYRDAAAHWYGDRVVGAEVQHMGAMLGWSRLAVSLGSYAPDFPGGERAVVAEPTGEDRAYAYQKHLLCHATHLRAVANELFAANESAVQLQVMSRFRSWNASVPVSAILSEKGLGARAPASANKAWLAAQKECLGRIPDLQQVSIKEKEYPLHIANADAIYREAKRILKRIGEVHEKKRREAEEAEEASVKRKRQGEDEAH